MGTLFVDKLDPQSGTSLEIGSNGDTITIPSGATIANSGTATGFGGGGVEGAVGPPVFDGGASDSLLAMASIGNLTGATQQSS